MVEIKKTGKFRNLEVISNSESKSASIQDLDSDSNRERRHLPRLILSSEQFRHSGTGKIFSVTDLSKKGMGLWLFDPADLKEFTVGSVFEGTLNLKREKQNVRARVRNLNSDRIGCEFENLSESTSQALETFLNPATLGAELKLIPSVERNTLWFHGPSGTDLLIVQTPEGEFLSITLYVLGSFVRWELDPGLSTGRTSPTDSHNEIRGIHRLESLYLDADPRVDSEKLEIAKTVILSSNLSSEMKSRCVSAFAQSS